MSQTAQSCWLASDLIQELVGGEPPSGQAPVTFLMEQMACFFLVAFLGGCAHLSPSAMGFWVVGRQKFLLK